jgi:DNA-binding MarR family transcriptional regulator
VTPSAQPTGSSDALAGADQAVEPPPSVDLDDTVHQRVRLGILSALVEVDRADFVYLRDLLHLTDGNLSRHLDVLARDHLVELLKGYEGRRARTWVKITRQGRGALRSEIDALRRLVERYDKTQDAAVPE